MRGNNIRKTEALIMASKILMVTVLMKIIVQQTKLELITIIR